VSVSPSICCKSELSHRRSFKCVFHLLKRDTQLDLSRHICDTFQICHLGLLITRQLLRKYLRVIGCLVRSRCFCPILDDCLIHYQHMGMRLQRRGITYNTNILPAVFTNCCIEEAIPQLFTVSLSLAIRCRILPCFDAFSAYRTDGDIFGVGFACGLQQQAVYIIQQRQIGVDRLVLANRHQRIDGIACGKVQLQRDVRFPSLRESQNCRLRDGCLLLTMRYGFPGFFLISLSTYGSANLGFG
jgi:hypothetical protein